MPNSLYETMRLLARAREWRAEAEAATLPEMRAYCLSEAERCDGIVRKSMETPPLAVALPVALGGKGEAPVV